MAHADSPSLTLRARAIPLPAADAIHGVLAEQLGPRLAQLRKDPEAYAPLITLVEFADADGVTRFEACLFRGEDGPVHRAGTTEFVASFSQSTATECDDDELADALEQALRASR